MSLSTAIDCIRQVGGYPFFKEIKITGGEPFLFYDSLVEMVGEIRRLGLKASLITNGFWAETEEVATKKLKLLVERGLGEINYSADWYHQAFIPFERVANAFRATRSLGLPVIIYYVQGASSGPLTIFLERCDLSPEDVVVLEADETFRISKLGLKEQASNGQDRVILRKTFVSPAGRGKNCNGELILFPTNIFPTTPCPEIGRSYMIMPNLDLFACCSGYLPPPLKVGNLRRGAFRRGVNKLSEDILLQTLGKQGVMFLYQKVSEAGCFSGHDAYAGMCHLCSHILSSLDRDRLEEILCEAFLEHLTGGQKGGIEGI